MNNLAWCLHVLLRAAEAVVLAREATSGHEVAFGPVHSETLIVLDTLAAALEANGCADEAAAVRARIAAANSTAQESTGDAHM